MEAELSLKEVQEIELEILKHLDTFCRENNIKYFLSYAKGGVSLVEHSLYGGGRDEL